MEYVYLFASSVLIIACLYFVVSPFFSGRFETAAASGADDKPVRLEDIYEAVNELEMEYLMKKISEKDFLQLKEQYQMLAVQLMKQEADTVVRKSKKDKAEEQAVEREILLELQKLRAQKGS